MGSETDSHSVSPNNFVLVFHKLTNKLTFGINNYSPRRFRQLLDYLQLRGIDLSNLQLTFDDAYEHLYHQLPPLMEWYGFKPFVFVPTAFIGKDNHWDFSHRLSAERHLNAEQITSLSKRGVQFGSHGHRHIDLTRLNDSDCRLELTRSKQLLEQILGRTVDQISYPFGRINDLVTKLARESGYVTGFTTQFPIDSDNSMTRGRYPVYAFDIPKMVRSKMHPGPSQRVQRMGASLISCLARGTNLYQKYGQADQSDD